MAKEIVVFNTVPDIKLAEKIAETLVREHLAACCNIVPHVTSIYFWEGRVQKDAEVLLIIKTSELKYEALEQRIKALHSYTVPEIIALPIENGSEEYLNWIREVVKQ